MQQELIPGHRGDVTNNRNNREDQTQANSAPDSGGATIALDRALDGFSQAAGLLEFDQIRDGLAGFVRTVLGRQRARELAPVSDVLEIATRQQETSEARRFLESGGGLEFGPGVDFQEYFQRAILGGLLRGHELHSTRLLVEAARSNRASLLRHEELPLISSVAENLPDLGNLAREIFSAISVAGEVLDDASPSLRDLRQATRAAYQRLNQTMERSLRRFQAQEVVQEPIITERNGRLVLLIKADMRSKAPGIVHDVSDSGATVFIEPMPAIELGNRWREVRRAEEREEERILRQLSTRVGMAGQDLLLLLDLLARLDLAMAKGRQSIALKAIEPSVSRPLDTHQSIDAGNPSGAIAERRLALTAARHPLLAGDVVPISVSLGAAQSVMLITGPNAGGKTVALKTAGLLALMAHAGLHVPAEQARFPALDGVYADIGDQQSIEQSLSTFSSHISNILSIMGRATDRSLVLLDELGTSTDPEEGSALAKSILSHFQEMGLLLVATTHHRGVARYVQETPGMVNASVDLHPQTLEPTYRVTQGLPGRSYALTIASRLGMPEAIVEQARTSLSPVELATENLLGELQRERVVVEDLRREAEESAASAREQQARIEAELANVELAKLDLVEQARRELQDRTGALSAQIQDAERVLERAWREQEPAAGQPRTQQPGIQLREQRDNLEQVRRALDNPQWQPIPVLRPEWQGQVAPGDRVYVRGIARPLEVVSEADGQGQIEVLLGAMRAKIPVYQLERPAQAVQPTPNTRDFHVDRKPRRQAGNEIDLRGLRVETALDQVETLLNDAALDESAEIKIIHGKGTGALRRAIREYLLGHPLVVESSPGEGAGGEGVTMVQLK